MADKFTPGEWVVDDSYSTMHLVVVRHSKGNETHICEIDVESSFDDHGNYEKLVTEEQGANAALIAAAPEMYRMLQRFIPCDDHGNGDFVYNDGSEEIGEEVNQLLAKVRGGV